METFISVAFAFAFPLFWIAVSLLLAHMGGWAKLAEKYPEVRNRVESPSETYRMRSGSVGATNYSKCLNLRVYDDGLRVSVLLPFRIGHPPLFIPWDQFHSVSEKRVLFFRFIDAYVGMPVVANVVLPNCLRSHFLPPADDFFPERHESEPA